MPEMLLPYVLLLLPVFVATQESQSSMNTLDREVLRRDDSRDLDWIGESYLNAVDALFSGLNSYDSIEVADRRKKAGKQGSRPIRRWLRYLIPLIIGYLLIKALLLPLILKALAVLSGKAVVLSLMSLILAAIVGLKKVAYESGYEHKYRRQYTYDYVDNVQEFEPYRFYKFYKERRKKK